MSWIIKWNVEEMVDHLPHEKCYEYFVVISPGKLPVSFKVPENATEAQIEVEKEKTILKAKTMLLDSLLKELGGKISPVVQNS